jgi:hypothetical protein
MHDHDDPELTRISHDAFGVLMGVVESMDPAEGAWATVHSPATLWLDGALRQFTDEDLFSLVQGVFAADVLT